MRIKCDSCGQWIETVSMDPHNCTNYSAAMIEEAFAEWWLTMPEVPADPVALARLAFLQGAAWATEPDLQDEGASTF